MRKFVSLALLLSGLACATREPRPQDLIVLQPADAGSELDVPPNASRPGGPLDIKPGDRWVDGESDAGRSQVFPMSPGGTQTPTDSVMPGAIVPR